MSLRPDYMEAFISSAHRFIACLYLCEFFLSRANWEDIVFFAIYDNKWSWRDKSQNIGALTKGVKVRDVVAQAVPNCTYAVMEA